MGKTIGKHAGDTVTLRRAEYERLLAKAGESVEADGPALPQPDAQGHLPAIEYIRASIGRELIRRRRAAGLTQNELSELANVRQETISRIESGKHTVSEAVMKRLEGVLVRREKAKGRQQIKARKVV